MPQLYIHKFSIKSGVWVFVPSPEAIKIGKEIKDEVETRWAAPDYYYHHQSGGHVSALKAHVNNSFFLVLDIQDFFGSINKTKVTRSLKNLFPYNDARNLANNTVLRHPDEGHFILPYGFIQSPIIASLCLYFSGFGQWLHRQQSRESLTISVYVDDIVVSANDDGILHPFLLEARAIGSKTGFHLNETKIQGPSRLVTAFNVELGQLSLGITDARLKDFSEVFEVSESERQQQGILHYIKSISRLQHDNFVIANQNFII